MLGEHLVAGEPVLGLDNDLQALEELTQTIGNDSQRFAARRTLNAPVIVQPGNVSERVGGGVKGRLRDFSSSGCGIITPQPLLVGNVFWLEVNDAELGVSGLFARCVRCRLIREGCYEQGFTFFSSPLQKSNPAATTPESLV